MTALEMHKEFLILYDKITNFDAPGYTPEELSRFLSKAQERVFFDSYHPLSNKFREGFEQTEARRKDLQELVIPNFALTATASQTGVLPNGKFYDLPTNCLFVVAEQVITSSSDLCKNNKRIRVKPITNDYYGINVNNPFKKPNINNYVWRLDYQTRRHEIITDGTFDIANYYISYIKILNPIIIDSSIIDGVTGPQNCQLNAIMHRRIVDEAVKIATGVTDPQLYQIKTIEQQQGE